MILDEALNHVRKSGVEEGVQVRCSFFDELVMCSFSSELAFRDHSNDCINKLSSLTNERIPESID